MKTILLATDGSPSAAKALEVAIELTGALDAKLRVVTVWHAPVYEYGYVPLQYAPELMEEQAKRARAVLDEAVAAAEEAGLEVTSDLRQGFSPDEICASARDAKADLVVIGAHGWGAFQRLIVGSVSNAVLHHAPCPVLVVRGDPEERAPELVGAGGAEAGR